MLLAGLETLPRAIMSAFLQHDASVLAGKYDPSYRISAGDCIKFVLCSCRMEAEMAAMDSQELLGKLQNAEQLAQAEGQLRRQYQAEYEKASRT